ncbi:hypothetical protein [Streptomyces griseorubiginosus]|uniref:Uncharacterized protein n=1 Tax=Streptomyces griseorubiginosus TaxID=67304 RepID=A0A101SAQ6_9ACTN|nr:hypothetical protein [Streptomyces griseorubiginosus]KUN70417.1 hypothetical protein AQJ54_04910 [Streptomyces griseorubiginosus]
MGWSIRASEQVGRPRRCALRNTTADPLGLAVQRPARVDLAVEVPLPNPGGRARLLGLYGRLLGVRCVPRA